MVLSLAAATTFAMAQAPETGSTAKPHAHGQHQQLTQDHFVNQRLSKMTEALSLTPDQQSKMKGILSDEWTRQQAIRSNTSLSQQDAHLIDHRRLNLRGGNARDHIGSDIAVFQDGLADIVPIEPSAAAGVGGRHRPAIGPEKAQLKPMFQQQREQMQALKADTSLTQDQKREKMQQLRADGRKQFLSVLTPEQQQKLRDMRAKHGERKGETNSQPGPGF